MSSKDKEKEKGFYKSRFHSLINEFICGSMLGELLTVVDAVIADEKRAGHVKSIVRRTVFDTAYKVNEVFKIPEKFAFKYSIIDLNSGETFSK